MDTTWSPTSWQSKPAAQQPAYADRAALDEALAKLHSLPPLVTSWEVESLKKQLAEAAEGKRFVLHGGDCAETLAECTSEAITSKLKVLLQMSLVLVSGGCKPVTRIGRFAGQYSKPRSSPIETRDGQTLPSYQGDLINRIEFTPDARRPDPRLMVRGYQHAAMTLNFIRSLVDAGFADLHHPEYWDLGFCENAALRNEYLAMTAAIAESIRFMETIGEAPIGDLARTEFFTSHEGLHLAFETAGTRSVPRRTGCYNLTTHFPWIGDRSRALDGAHVEYFRGIRNPIGVKIGPTITPDELLRLTQILNPDNEPGRLVIIHRLGRASISATLPALITTITKAKRAVLWMSDPMHGNTKSTPQGRKTRAFDDILAELESAFDIHESTGTRLAGVHFELTGDRVTECTGGARGLSETDLAQNYRTQCDPRLNYEQALEMSFLVARRLKKTAPARRP